MKYIISLIALSAVVLSTALTLAFMVQIGSPTGLTAVFIGVGLVMELTKTILPVLVLKSHKLGNNPHTIALGILSALLMAVSFSASIVSVEAGAEGTRKLSSEYTTMTQRIDTLQAQAIDIRKNVDALPSDYLTQRSKLNAEAMGIDAQVDTLMSQRVTLKPNSIIVQYGSSIAVITATIIELITLLFVPMLFSGTVVSRTVTKPEDTRQDSVTVADTATVFTKTITVTPTLDDAIKQAVIEKRVKPSVRGVRGMFTGISNSRISDILKGLGNDGFLAKNGQGWTYIS